MRPRSGATSFGEETKIVTFRTRASGMAEFHSEGSVIARPEMADGPPSIPTSYTDPRASCGCRASQCVPGTGPDEGLSLRHLLEPKRDIQLLPIMRVIGSHNFGRGAGAPG